MENAKCLVQLDEILTYLSEEEINKIPNEIRQNIKNKKDTNYIWNYDTTKGLIKQKIDRKTIAMLSYLNMEYLLNEEQKELMKQIHELNENKAEQIKKQRFNMDSLFSHRKN